MFKVNKKLILMLILVMIVGILSGCGKQIKAPEGVDQEFYDDMVECLDKLAKYKDDDENNGIDTVEFYMENKVYMQTTREDEIIEAIDDLYFWAINFNIKDKKDKLIIKNKIGNISNLMEIDLDINKFMSTN